MGLMSRAAIAAIVMLVAGGARAEVLARWVQYAPNNGLMIRALTTEKTCPALSVDGAPTNFAVRFEPNAKFPVTECEATLPIGAKGATIADAPVKLPVAKAHRVVIVGDTGCRITKTQTQACNDPDKFPLAKLSQAVAAAKPDVILHTGDFYYREVACPVGDAGCAGSPFGENWASWNADWFTPAKVLMEAAPLVLARGNHESCGRGAVGWFTLLDTRPYDQAAVDCAKGSPSDLLPAFVADLGSVKVIVHDSTFADDETPRADVVESYRADLDRVLGSLSGDAWFLTHKPAFGVVGVKKEASGDVVSAGNATMRTVFKTGTPAPIKLMISGHLHSFHTLDLGPTWAPQMVVGNSGTLRDPDVFVASLAGASYASPEIATPIVRGRVDGLFGYVVLDQVNVGWVGTAFNMDGRAVAQCVLASAQRTLDCGTN